MEGEEQTEVTVDGISVTRETRLVWDNGRRKHHPTEEEKEIFVPGVPCEGFVEARR